MGPPDIPRAATAPLPLTGPTLVRRRLPRGYGACMADPVETTLTELRDLLARIEPGAGARPTPCPDMDVAELRRHVLSWLPVFATALSDADGTAPRPDVDAYVAPGDAATAAAEAGVSAATISAALAGGVRDRPVRLTGDQPLPGSMVLGMVAGETIAHGWDLARATGLPWDPPAAACEAALATMGAMLAPEYRGEGKSFGNEVPIPAEASALDRLIAFTGLDPRWAPTG